MNFIALQGKMLKKIIPIFHAVLLIASLLSPFWADWRIIAVGYILYIAQKWIFKGCILSFAEFGSSKGKPREHFTPYYLKKFFGIRAEEYLIMRYLDYLIAPLVPIFAIVIQLLFNYRPIIAI